MVKIGSQVKKLHKRIHSESKFKLNSPNKFIENEIPIISKNMIFKDENKNIAQHLNFLKKILDLIEKGATGFDLAYKVEKNQEIKNLIYDGILFYNTFIEIGNKKFKDVPDKKKVDYKAFRTIEDTEKYIFMVWLKDTILSIEKEIKPKEDFIKYTEDRKAFEIKKKREQLREALTHCKNCRERIKSKTQEFCERCGKNLMEQIYD